MPPEYFEALYTANPDPWRFASSDYERRKYQATLDMMADTPIRHGFEIGCSIGVLTSQLAGRCGDLLAVDGSPTALRIAARNCAGHRNLRLRQMHIPGQWPDQHFDFILFSEVLYYLAPDDIARTAALTVRSLTANGIVLMVHWTGPTDYPVSGDDAATLFMRSAPNLVVRKQERHPEYRMDLLRLE